MISLEERRSRWVLGAAGAFAIAWAIARATVQSITIDEAVTYNIFVFDHRYLWYAANNHILNSALIFVLTRVFGLSQFTVRLPALIGAAFYITAVYRFCRLLGTSLFVQVTLFICLVFNPLVFDFLVAARGYGLALGFLMWALVYAAEAHLYDRPLVACCAVSSLCAGMSVDANFSFAFVNLAAMAAIFLFAAYRRPNQWLRLLAACVLPAAATVAIVCRYALLHTHPGELIYGARSLSETFGSIFEASLFQTDFDFFLPIVFPLVGVTGLLWLAYVLIRRAKTRVAPLGWAAAAIFGVTVAIHWTAFRLFGLLLPKDRTAIYFFPLFIIAAGVLAAVPPASRVGRNLQRCFIASLAVMAVYFLLCVRLTYFKEWYWDSDVPKAYDVLSCLNREHKVTSVASTWPYHAPLTFYLHARPVGMRIDENFTPQQTQVYVVDTLHTPEALQGKDLKVFYKSPTTDLVLAASPQLAEMLAMGRCFGNKTP